MRQVLCNVGIHRWDFADERNGDELWTWGWCKNPHCPHFHKPWVVDAEWRPMARETDERDRA